MADLSESFNDALIACVKACGGSAQVGRKLWPEKTPDAAQRLLLDCLNDDRPARLTPDQVLLLLRMARDKGCHIGMQFIAATLSYAEPQPIEPKDEADDLRRQLLEETRSLNAKLQRLEDLDNKAQQRMRAVA